MQISIINKNNIIMNKFKTMAMLVVLEHALTNPPSRVAMSEMVEPTGWGGKSRN